MYSSVHDAPEFELAAHLPVFNLDELIVAGRHAAVLHKPLEAEVGVERQSGEKHKRETAMRVCAWQLKLPIWPTWRQLHVEPDANRRVVAKWLDVPC